MHAVAAGNVIHAEGTDFVGALDDACAANVGLSAALQPTIASIVELAAADAGVAYIAVVSARLALTVVAANVRLAAVIVGGAL